MCFCFSSHFFSLAFHKFVFHSSPLLTLNLKFIIYFPFGFIITLCQVQMKYLGDIKKVNKRQKISTQIIISFSHSWLWRFAVCEWWLILLIKESIMVEISFIHFTGKSFILLSFLSFINQLNTQETTKPHLIIKMRKVFNMITSTAASLVRMGLGSQVLKNSSSFKKPKTLLTLYVKESCPFSRYFTLKYYNNKWRIVIKYWKGKWEKDYQC